MKNWTDSLHFLKTSLDSVLLNAFRVISRQTLSLGMLAFLLSVNYTEAMGQLNSNHTVYNLPQELRELKQSSNSLINGHMEYALSEIASDTVPAPSKVLYQSLMVPGWGQVTNRQIWKVPVIYGLLAGVTVYAFYANDRYDGYKAAYYNSFAQNTDLRFGPTPTYISTGQPPELYRTTRNTFRNRRDLSILGIVLIYGLNVADAYIFAHLRDFDVSDDLSLRFEPEINSSTGQKAAILKLTLSF